MSFNKDVLKIDPAAVTERLVADLRRDVRQTLRRSGAAVGISGGVDSSVVLVNASTRFNDGNQLGLGAEIGISTSKLHAFGPMGLEELTTSKFVVYGNGQIRG